MEGPRSSQNLRAGGLIRGQTMRKWPWPGITAPFSSEKFWGHGRKPAFLAELDGDSEYRASDGSGFLNTSRQGGLRVWTVVYIASNRTEAEMLKDLLTKEGLLVMLRPLGVPHQGDAANFEILVPEGEVAEAHEILAGYMGR